VLISKVSDQIKDATEASRDINDCIAKANDFLDIAFASYYAAFEQSRHDVVNNVLTVINNVQILLTEISGLISKVEQDLPRFLQSLHGASTTGAGNPAKSHARRAAPSKTSGPAKRTWTGGSDIAQVARTIAIHARHRTIAGVDADDVPRFLADVMRHPGYPLKPTPSGKPRMAWWNDRTGLIVIRSGNGGTFLYPDNGRSYLRMLLGEQQRKA
jgi:hypothetical protein